MKRCPHCNDISSYGDWEDFCPVCNTRLVMDSDVSSTGSQVSDEAVSVVSPLADIRDEYNMNSQDAPVFENDGTFRGRVSHVQTITNYHSRFKKVIFSILRGEPYQFGHSSKETVIRLEEMNNDTLNPTVRQFVLYGDVEGRVNVGDDVTITARRRGDRYMVSNLYSNSVESRIRPKPQLPSWLFSGAFGAVILLLLLLILSGELINVIVYFIVLFAVLRIARGMIFRR